MLNKNFTIKTSIFVSHTKNKLGEGNFSEKNLIACTFFRLSLKVTDKRHVLEAVKRKFMCFDKPFALNF